MRNPQCVKIPDAFHEFVLPIARNHEQFVPPDRSRADIANGHIETLIRDWPQKNVGEAGTGAEATAVMMWVRVQQVSPRQRDSAARLLLYGYGDDTADVVEGNHLLMLHDQSQQRRVLPPGTYNLFKRTLHLPQKDNAKWITIGPSR